MIKYYLLCFAMTAALLGCGKDSTGNSAEVTLEELNRALSAVAMSSPSYPSDVNQLTNFPSIQGRPLPTPPAGKKLVIDQTRREVVFADQ